MDFGTCLLCVNRTAPSQDSSLLSCDLSVSLRVTADLGTANPFKLIVLVLERVRFESYEPDLS